MSKTSECALAHQTCDLGPYTRPTATSEANRLLTLELEPRLPRSPEQFGPETQSHPKSWWSEPSVGKTGLTPETPNLKWVLPTKGPLLIRTLHENPYHKESQRHPCCLKTSLISNLRTRREAGGAAETWPAAWQRAAGVDDQVAT